MTTKQIFLAHFIAHYCLRLRASDMSKRVIEISKNQHRIGEIFSKITRSEPEPSSSAVPSNEQNNVVEPKSNYFDQYISQRKIFAQPRQNSCIGQWKCEKAECQSLFAENLNNKTKLKDAKVVIDQLRAKLFDYSNKCEENDRKRELENAKKEEMDKLIASVCSS